MNTLKENNLKYNDYLDNLRSKDVQEYQEKLVEKNIEKKENDINKPSKTPYIMKQYMFQRKEHVKDLEKVNKVWRVVDEPDKVYKSKSGFENIQKGLLNSEDINKKPWNKLNSVIKTNRLKEYSNRIYNDKNGIICKFITHKYYEKCISNKDIDYDIDNGTINNIECF